MPDWLLNLEEEGEFTFDPTVEDCKMEVRIAYSAVYDLIEFEDSWQCRRYAKGKHQYINISVELYGYNVFGLAQTEPFEADGAYQGKAFRELFEFDPDAPFSEAGVCYKVRPKTSKGRWSKLSCFETVLPPDLLGPAEE